MTQRSFAEFAMLERRPCPGCGALDPERVFEQRFARIGAGSLLSGYEVVSCRACGCGYADRLPPQSAFDAYYRDLSKYEHQDRDGRESELDLARFREIAALISRFVPERGARVLDVGCATGGLLASLRDLGLARVMGVDPSSYCADAAARLYGIPVRTGTLSDDLADGEPFGMIVLVGVLEHVRDLTPALSRVRGLLRAHGRIYVEVPDATRFSEFLDAPYQQFSVEHVAFFSAASLDRVLTRHGFTRVYLERDARPDTAASVMPVITAVYERTDAEAPTLARDESTLPALRDYVARSAAMDAGIRAVIDRLADGHQPVVVWGVGTHTARLLETSRLREANIRAFVDSNPRYHGKELAGIPVLPPESLRERSEPVLVSSRVFQGEIAGQIRNELRCSNEIILLYPS
jgi:SAM-dependent methyltransferase